MLQNRENNTDSEGNKGNRGLEGVRPRAWGCQQSQRQRQRQRQRSDRGRNFTQLKRGNGLQALSAGAEFLRKLSGTAGKTLRRLQEQQGHWHDLDKSSLRKVKMVSQGGRKKADKGLSISAHGSDKQSRFLRQEIAGMLCF